MSSFIGELYDSLIQLSWSIVTSLKSVITHIVPIAIMKKLFSCIGKEKKRNDRTSSVKNRTLVMSNDTLDPPYEGEFLELHDNVLSYDKLTEKRQQDVLVQMQTTKRPEVIWSALHMIVSEENIASLRALLPVVPLHVICLEKIPADSEWCDTSVGEFLQKERQCLEAIQLNPLNTTSMLNDYAEKLSKIPRAVYSALSHLLTRSIVSQAKNCMLHLLEIAPMIVNMTEAQGQGQNQSQGQIKLPLHVAVSRGLADFVEVFQSHGGVFGDIDHCKALEDIFQKPKGTCDVGLATRLLAEGHEDKFAIYKDHNGGSLLHTLFDMFGDSTSHFHQVSWFSVVAAAATLLRLGVNPTERNSFHQTALDVLIFHVRTVIKFNQYQTSEKVAMLKAMRESARLVVPHFKHNKACEYNPLVSVSYASKHISNSEIAVEFLSIFQLLIEAEVFDINEESSYGHTAFQYLLNGRLLRLERQSPCLVCDPLVNLFVTALHQGLDIKHSVNMSGARESRFNKFEPTTYMDILLKRLVYFRSHNPWSDTPDPDATELPFSCCCLSLLDLFLHCGVGHSFYIEGGMGPQVTELLIKYARSPGVQRAPAYQVLKSMCWYLPSAVVSLRDQVSHLHSWSEDADDIADVLEFEKQLDEVVPLKMLSRRCVLRYVGYRDLHKLELPPLLMHYVRMGDYMTYKMADPVDHPKEDYFTQAEMDRNKVSCDNSLGVADKSCGLMLDS